MRLLSIDVGRGTQDIVLYDSDKNWENCTSLIIPSRGLLLEKLSRQAVAEGKTPLFWGHTMGGFPLLKHAPSIFKDKIKILATAAAAKTFHNNLTLVQEQGVTLVSEQEALELKNSDQIMAMETKDVDWGNLKIALIKLGEDPQIDGIAVAVQDHGQAPPGVSNRLFRFQQHRRILDHCPDLSHLAFPRPNIPKLFTRMLAVSDSLPQELPFLVMDTGWAAILGALEDDEVAQKRRKIIVNLGNAHALAAYLDGEQILGLWEHHTSLLTAERLKVFLTKLAEGTITQEEIFASDGHGAYVKTVPQGGVAAIDLIALTGPNRERFADPDYYLAAPHGNMMLSGSYGLIRAWRAHF
ncbi:MAG: pyruvate formate lyase-activating protein [Candidatus Schekmanbacteria bacterium]|nr:pyruvate formate lyase-activating protein [Candidatus Schekmanbacteria bacterium]